MQGLKETDYLSGGKRRFDPVAVIVSIALLALVLSQAIGPDASLAGGDLGAGIPGDSRSFLFVVGGTLGVLLFQFDLEGERITIDQAVGIVGGFGPDDR